MFFLVQEFFICVSFSKNWKKIKLFKNSLNNVNLIKQLVKLITTLDYSFSFFFVSACEATTTTNKHL